MSANGSSAELAFRAASLLKAEPPWEVVAERSRRYEIHLQGTRIELERGPVTAEGYGVRLLRPRGGTLGVGFQASTDVSLEGVAAAADDANAAARHAEFPAKSVELPSGNESAPSVPVVDPKLWSDPLGALRGYVDTLLGEFDGRNGVVPSFGSVKAVLSEVSITNSSGLRAAFSSTTVELEVAVKAFGGPEGRPPGEYWVNDAARRLEPERLERSVDDWCRYAADVRRAVPPPSGELPVVLTTEVLDGILPIVLGTRFSGQARLRKIAPELGSEVGVPELTIRDEGEYAWSPGSAPYDDEGRPHVKTTLIDRGAVGAHLYDALYASALGARSTASARRTTVGPSANLRFAFPPHPEASTTVVLPGDGGSLDELVEEAGDGVLVTQLGWAQPDPVSSEFGGEIRIGYRIRGGKIAEPLRGGTVGGAGLAPAGAASLLRNLAGIGSSSERSGTLVSPPLLARPLTVAGA